MIEFIELIDVKINNPNYEKELTQFKLSDSFNMLPPDEFSVRKENVDLGVYQYVPLFPNEHVVIEGEDFIVLFSDPKTFYMSGFCQKVYLKRL